MQCLLRSKPYREHNPNPGLTHMPHIRPGAWKCCHSTRGKGKTSPFHTMAWVGLFGAKLQKLAAQLQASKLRLCGPGTEDPVSNPPLWARLLMGPAFSLLLCSSHPLVNADSPSPTHPSQDLPLDLWTWETRHKGQHTSTHWLFCLANGANEVRLRPSWDSIGNCASPSPTPQGPFWIQVIASHPKNTALIATRTKTAHT